MSSVRISNRERRGLDPSEHIEAKRFMAMVRMHEARLPALEWLAAVPNGGWRNKTVAAKLKAEGVRPGFHDYCWPFRASGYSGLFIELKSRTGRPSPDQRKFGEFVESQGFKVVYARGWEEAWRAVCEYAGLPYRVM